MIYFLEDKIYRILHPQLTAPNVHFKLKDIQRSRYNNENEVEIKAATIRCEKLCKMYPFFKQKIFQCHFRNKIATSVFLAHPKPSFQEYMNSTQELFKQGFFCETDAKFFEEIKQLLIEFDVD